MKLGYISNVNFKIWNYNAIGRSSYCEYKILYKSKEISMFNLILFFSISPPNFYFISEILSLRKIFFYPLLFIVCCSTAQESNNLLSLYTHVHTYTRTEHLSSLCFHTVSNEIETYYLLYMARILKVNAVINTR